MGQDDSSKISFSRTFTQEDIEIFANNSLVQDIHQATSTDKDRQIVRGFITATLSTNFGGVNDVLTQSMNFKFLSSLYIRDTITCKTRKEKHAQKQNGRVSVQASFICINTEKVEIVKGMFLGVIS